MFLLLLAALVLEIPNANGDTKHGEEQFAQRFEAMLVVGLPDGVTADANSGEDKIPPFPFFGLAIADGFQGGELLQW